MPPWPPDSATLRLRVPSGAAGAATACAAAARHLAAADLPANAGYRAELVLEELIMNLALHAGGPEADVAVARVAEGVLLQVEDDAAPFDPTAAALPEGPPSLDATAPGGLGLALVRKSARAWHYERVDGRRNRLTVLIGA